MASPPLGCRRATSRGTWRTRWAPASTGKRRGASPPVSDAILPVGCASSLRRQLQREMLLQPPPLERFRASEGDEAPRRSLASMSGGQEYLEYQQHIGQTGNKQLSRAMLVDGLVQTGSTAADGVDAS
jgi:hypothetical protein